MRNALEIYFLLAINSISSSKIHEYMETISEETAMMKRQMDAIKTQVVTTDMFNIGIEKLSRAFNGKENQSQ
jgi:hypothetical protein